VAKPCCGVPVALDPLGTGEYSPEVTGSDAYEAQGAGFPQHGFITQHAHVTSIATITSADPHHGFEIVSRAGVAARCRFRGTPHHGFINQYQLCVVGTGGGPIAPP